MIRIFVLSQKCKKTKMTIALPTAGLVVVKNNKLLLAFSNNKKAWYLPGGKMDEGETAQEALIREVEEELNLELDTDRLQYFCHTTAPAFGESENVVMEQECFLYDLREEIEASHEIGAVKYFDWEMYKLEPQQVPGVLHIFAQLKKNNLVNYKE